MLYFYTTYRNKAHSIRDEKLQCLEHIKRVVISRIHRRDYSWKVKDPKENHIEIACILKNKWKTETDVGEKKKCDINEMCGSFSSLVEVMPKGEWTLGLMTHFQLCRLYSAKW